MAERITTAFPDDLASNHVKDSDAYGLEVAEAIESQWFFGNLSKRRAWIDLMRSYARGEQDVQQYKDTIEGTRDEKSDKIGVKTHKIDYTQLKTLASFRDIVINPIDESLFKPRAEAIDITAINKKKAVFKKFDKAFHLREFNSIIEKGTGAKINGSDIPKNEEALKIKKLEYKSDIEIAQELAIENVMKLEKMEAIKDKQNEDLFDLGFAVGRHYTDYAEGIKLKGIDPYNWIHSPFETDDGRDIRYEGEVDKATIVELQRISGRKFTEAEFQTLKNLSIGASDMTDNSDPYTEEADGGRLIEYITFSYLTGKKRIFKKLRKDKIVKLIDRTKDEEEYNPKRADKKIEIPFHLYYEGIYVPSAKLLLKWSPIENQVEDGINKPERPFVIYAPKIKRLSEKGNTRFDSLTQRAIPIIDDIHRDWLKFQQLKMELRPNTVVINPQALENVFLSGKKVTGQDILDMYFGRGILLANELDSEGDPVGKAIQEQGGGVNNTGLVFLSGELVKSYDRLRNLLGINEVRDGTNKPNSKTAVAVQKMLLVSSNNATSHIVRGSFNISLQYAKGISLRLVDVLNNPNLKNRYINAIGSDNVELLDAIKETPMHKYAIYFDFKPDDEERVVFERSLADSYSQKEINVAQYNKARMIRNVKSAIKYLEFIIRENLVLAEKLKVKNIQANAEAQAKTGLIVEKSKQKTINVQWDLKRRELLLTAQISDKSKVKEALITNLLNEKEHVRNMQLKGLEVTASVNKEATKEEERKNRIDQTSTNTSKQIEQKQNSAPAITFGNELEDIIKDNKVLLENTSQEPNLQ